jgi:biopolymer transport protein ExbD
MRRRFRPRHRLAAGRLDAAPLVNIALLLFLFYMVGSPFVLQPGVIVNLPGSSFHAGAPYGAMVVTISQEGMVFFNDERTTVKGLAAAFQQAAHDAPDSTLVIEADGGVRHSLLVDIYNMAEAAGIRRVALATRVTAPAATGP